MWSLCIFGYCICTEPHLRDSRVNPRYYGQVFPSALGSLHQLHMSGTNEKATFQSVPIGRSTPDLLDSLSLTLLLHASTFVEIIFYFFLTFFTLVFNLLLPMPSFKCFLPVSLPDMDPWESPSSAVVMGHYLTCSVHTF